MGFFSVPTVTFRALQILLLIRYGRHLVACCAVAANPAAAWVAQQLREGFPFDSAPSFMIFDRGAVFSSVLTAMLRSLLLEPRRTSYRSPWQNGVAERFVAKGDEGADQLAQVPLVGTWPSRRTKHTSASVRIERAGVRSSNAPALAPTSSASLESAACIIGTPSG